MTELLPAVRKACPHLFIIALNGSPDTQEEALAGGADAFVSKTDPPELLLAAIESARAETQLT